MDNIIWLASYPKSGNTWLRAFLSNLMSDSTTPVDINQFNIGGPISSTRLFFDEYTGMESAHLSYEEIDNLLPKVHNMFGLKSQNKHFRKVHDAITLNSKNEPIIPIESTFRAIYLIRNPLDVCVSYAYHAGDNGFDRAIAAINNPEYTFEHTRKKQNNQLHQRLLSWSKHVKSWQQYMNEKLLIIRYEDMKHQTLESFSKIVQFVALEYGTEDIQQALEFCKLSKLQEQENKKGFKEKLYKSQRFFRKGKTGSWREELTPQQIQLVINHHQEVMLEFGYLDNNLQPIF